MDSLPLDSDLKDNGLEDLPLSTGGLGGSLGSVSDAARRYLAIDEAEEKAEPWGNLGTYSLNL